MGGGGRGEIGGCFSESATKVKKEVMGRRIPGTPTMPKGHSALYRTAMAARWAAVVAFIAFVVNGWYASGKVQMVLEGLK